MSERLRYNPEAAEDRRLRESGWQKPVAPPKADARPTGPPPASTSQATSPSSSKADQDE